MDISELKKEAISDFTIKNFPTSSAKDVCQEVLSAVAVRKGLKDPDYVKIHKGGFVIGWGTEITSKLRMTEILVTSKGLVHPSPLKGGYEIQDCVDWIEEKLKKPPVEDIQTPGLVTVCLVVVEKKGKIEEIIGAYNDAAAEYVVKSLRNRPHKTGYASEDYRVILFDQMGEKRYIFD